MKSSHRPKAVVFDIGNVLLDFTYAKTVERIKQQSRLTEPELRVIFSQNDLFNRYESGQLSTPEYFSKIQELTGYSGSLDEFAEFFGDIFTEVPPMIAWNDELQNRGIPTYILSNTNEMSIRYIRKAFPFFSNFTGYAFSHEVRAMKPAARIYERIEEISGLRGADLFYMDDRIENVEGALARGWQAVHHVQPLQTLEVARSLGL